MRQFRGVWSPQSVAPIHAPFDASGHIQVSKDRHP